MGGYFQYLVNTEIEGIYDSRTKAYFQEVFGCYVAGYYRSAIVMLWSVVVVDLFFKLKDLVDIYGDDGAKTLLKEIECLQSKNVTSPEWELALLRGMEEKVPFLTRVERTKLEHLQKLRHSAAHPLLSAGQVLEIPSKQEVEAEILVSLESVFSKSPIFSLKIWDRFVEDIERVYKLTPEISVLQRFLSEKYFNKLRKKTFVHLFYRLWRIVAHSDDQRCIENLKANQVALVLFAKEDPDALKENIRENCSKYSDIQVSDVHLDALYRFFSECPSFFKLMHNPLASTMNVFIEKDANRYIRGWFVSPSIEKHLENFQDDVSRESFHDTLRALGNSGHLLLVWGIEQYSKSWCFDKADERYSNYIAPVVDRFSEENFKMLLSLSEGNEQTYKRYRAAYEYKNLKGKIAEKYPEFSFSAYPNFLSVINP